MSSHRLMIGAAVLFGIVTVSSASPPPRLIGRALGAAPGPAHLMAFGGRSTAQLHTAGGVKLDAALADLTRHASLVRPGHALEDLHSLSPAAHFMQRGRGAAPMVLIDAVTRGDPQRLRNALVSVGLQHASVYLNDVSGWLPVSAIDTAAARGEVHSLRAAMWHTRAVLATQGDFVQGTRSLRGSYVNLTGAGVTVGILSDSFDCYHVYAQPGSGVPTSGGNGYASNGFTADAEMDVAAGALPASVTVLAEPGQGSPSGTCMDFGPPAYPPFADEGRAMSQIVHAVAPGARLAFRTASEGEADFANGISALATAGAKVIADDIGYFDEPFFQDGLLAQAVDTVNAQGVAYFSAAGNNGALAYDNTTPSFNTTSTLNPGENLLNFDASGAATASAMSVTIAPLVPGEFLAVVVEWDQPYVTGSPGSPGASSRIDLCVSGASGYLVTNLDGNPLTCTGPNAAGRDPVQVLIIGDPANAAGNTVSTNVDFTVGLVAGTRVPGHIKLAVEDDGAGSTVNTFPTSSATLQGHPGAAGAAAVGAAFFLNTPPCGLVSSPVVDHFSAAGGAPILFDTSGNRLATAVIRAKPDFVGPDGVNDTFLGFTFASAVPPIMDTSSVAGCANDVNAPNFFGTSAATPHAAGLAALMLQANASVSPADIYQAIRSSAVAINPPAPNFNSGYGFIDATAAMAALPAGPPQVSLADSTITAGSSTTLSWLAVNSSVCTASGSWSGAQTTSGVMSITPTTAGTETYTLTCTSAAGSQSGSATLTVQAAPMMSSGGGGGGGSLEGATLLGLAGLGLARLLRAARA
ncbi:MAG: S8 family serine peptidase, partial [Steroidobacteraceae bacterium]